MSPLVIAMAVFVAVTALVGAVAMMLRDKPASRIEDRLDVMTGLASPTLGKAGGAECSVLSQPLDMVPGFFDAALGRFGNLELLFEQANTSLTISRLLLICAILGLIGTGVGAAVAVHIALIPVLGLTMAVLPFVWLFLRRRKRFKAFAVQLPNALEMLARSLRAGQSLASGFSAVAAEMSAPVGTEFGRVFEELNLGIPLEESLGAMGERIPNLDLMFFNTAVILQRQTGGDLAEILDKIGSLIRERFQIWGQIQSLTGEGRLSGIILLALPIVLFVTVYQMNPDYVMVLFTDPMGKKMLAGAAVMQVLGALTIKKIVNIKV